MTQFSLETSVSRPSGALQGRVKGLGSGYVLNLISKLQHPPRQGFNHERHLLEVEGIDGVGTSVVVGIPKVGRVGEHHCRIAVAPVVAVVGEIYALHNPR